MLLILWTLLLQCACATTPPRIQTTFLQSVDLVDMTDRMAESFVRDPIISARTTSEERWVISISRVVNHTNQLIPDNQKWLYVGRLRASLAQTDVSKQRSLIWVIPPERWPIVARELGVSEEPYGLRMNPTHQLTAEFHTLTNTSAMVRSDAYLCSYQLVDLRSGTITWEDSWEVKRVETGLSYD